MRFQDLLPVPRWDWEFDRLGPPMDMFSEPWTVSPVAQQHDLKQIGDNLYRLSLEVPGFERDDLTVEIEQGTLIVRGAVDGEQKHDEGDYLYRGFVRRGFERAIRLGEEITVKGASLENGVLNIDFEAEVPEARKPRRIEIKSGNGGFFDRAKRAIGGENRAAK